MNLSTGTRRLTHTHRDQAHSIPKLNSCHAYLWGGRADPLERISIEAVGKRFHPSFCLGNESNSKENSDEISSIWNRQTHYRVKYRADSSLPASDLKTLDHSSWAQSSDVVPLHKGHETGTFITLHPQNLFLGIVTTLHNVQWGIDQVCGSTSNQGVAGKFWFSSVVFPHSQFKSDLAFLTLSGCRVATLWFLRIPAITVPWWLQRS